MSVKHLQRRDSVIVADLELIDQLIEDLPPWKPLTREDNYFELGDFLACGPEDTKAHDHIHLAYQILYFLKTTSMGVSHFGRNVMGNPSFVQSLVKSKNPTRGDTARICRAYMKGYSDLHFFLTFPAPRYERSIRKWILDYLTPRAEKYDDKPPPHKEGIDPKEVNVSFNCLFIFSGEIK